MKPAGAPCWSFFLSLRTRLSQATIALPHEHGLKDELDGAWAVRPLEIRAPSQSAGPRGQYRT
jgi:hypothetical protein